MNQCTSNLNNNIHSDLKEESIYLTPPLGFNNLRKYLNPSTFKCFLLFTFKDAQYLVLL